MLCRLHRLTRDRYQDIAKSKKALALGKTKMNPRIRDYLTLIYAIEIQHPYIKEEFPYKKVLLTEQVYDKIEEARNAILETQRFRIPKQGLPSWRRC